MKREICCPECAEEWKGKGKPRKFPSLNSDGEGMRQVEGETLMGCTCDGCGKPLPAGATAVAVSIYSDDRPYFAWEDEYLVEAPAQEATRNHFGRKARP